MSAERVDVLVVGAGISGISAAHHLQTLCPEQSVAIVEARRSLGGTWDLFRYPGVRSDSDMHTLGFSFRPWTDRRSIAGADAILDYLRETARASGIEPRIRYGLRLVRADWSSEDATWTVQLRREDGEDGDAGGEVTATGDVVTMRCGFLFLCCGYYDYRAGHCPDFPGLDRYRGRFVHPQHWPEGLDIAGRRVVVIGSGATAVTLVPALAATAAHVTMLQRSPTWMVARPSLDPLDALLRRVLPQRAALALARWKNVLLAMLVFRLCRSRPAAMRKLFLSGVARALGPGADLADYTPRHDPWRERLCLVPDADFFAAVRAGRASVVTDRVDSFTETGVRLVSGRTLDADLVVSATGLSLVVFGHAELRVDGRLVEPGEAVQYKGAMLSGVPNMAHTLGYVNASWTLKADLTSRYVCRVLAHMRKRGARVCMPPEAGPASARLPWSDFSSGYFARAAGKIPSQGTTRPWRFNQNVLSDIVALRWRRVDDGVLRFS